jgi:hypothetical protein
MENLTKALDAGKRRGYDEVREVAAVKYLYQYALKKEKGTYETYFLKIEEAKLDVFEDYAEEEMHTFQTLEDALEYLVSNGADISKLSAIKGTLPF